MLIDQTQATSNCYPYTSPGWLQPPSLGIQTGYYNFRCYDDTRMGDFDLHLDRNGNLRVIRDGKLIGQFYKKEEEAR